MERRLRTSASMPYLDLSCSAATRDWPTQRERVTMVRSLPGRSILALPNYISISILCYVLEEVSYGNDKVVFLDGFAHGEGEAVEKPGYVSACL